MVGTMDRTLLKSGVKGTMITRIFIRQIFRDVGLPSATGTPLSVNRGIWLLSYMFQDSSKYEKSAVFWKSLSGTVL